MRSKQNDNIHRLDIALRDLNGRQPGAGDALALKMIQVTGLDRVSPLPAVTPPPALVSTREWNPKLVG